MRGHRTEVKSHIGSASSCTSGGVLGDCLLRLLHSHRKRKTTKTPSEVGNGELTRSPPCLLVQNPQHNAAAQDFVLFNVTGFGIPWNAVHGSYDCAMIIS